MKNLFQFLAISLVVAVAPGICNAQLVKGQWHAGGSMYLTYRDNAAVNGSTTTLQPSTTAVGFIPELGYMLTGRWSLQAGLGYTNTITGNQKSGSDSEVKSTPRFVFRPSVRRYLFGGRGGLFVQGDMNIGVGSNDTRRDNTVTSHSVLDFYVGAHPGLAYFANDRILLIASFAQLGFQTTKENTGDNRYNMVNEFRFVINSSSLSFGALYFF